LEARRALGLGTCRPAAASLLACAAAISFAACGGKRQDADEPKGNFPVEVLQASFPQQQKLAKSSRLVIVVRNAGSKTIPDIAVTVNGFDTRRKNPELADPNRPIFVVDARDKQIGSFPESQPASPPGCDSAYSNTWACGPLRPGRVKRFQWTVTAVEAGPFTIRYTVAAGLDGRAKAVDPSGDVPRGSFAGTVSDVPPQARVADDGHTIIHGTR
jgi:hypothetical protein